MMQALSELGNKFVRATRPKINDIIGDEIYGMRRQVLDQEARVHTLTETLVQAQALLDLRRQRLVELSASAALK